MTKFKYAPKGIPPLELTPKEFAKFEKEMNRKLTKKEIAHLKHCREVYRKMTKIPEDDMLKELLRLQKEFQDKYHYDPASWCWATAMGAECMELWAKSGGKWWKKKQTPRKERIEELVDVLHFFLGYMLCEKITAEELFEEYKVKLAENYHRQEQGY